MTSKAGWLLVNEILARLRSAVPKVAHCVGAEDAEELIQDARCHAARILHSAEARGGRRSRRVMLASMPSSTPGAAVGARVIAAPT